MAIDVLITVAVLIIVTITFIAAGVKTVPQGNNWTIERFGRYTHTLKPGLNIIIPFVDSVVTLAIGKIIGQPKPVDHHAVPGLKPGVLRLDDGAGQVDATHHGEIMRLHLGAPHAVARP